MRYAKPLIEKYRPRRLEQVRGHDKAVQMVKTIVDRPGFDGGAFLIQGATGAGKTSVARGIADRVGVGRDAWNYTSLEGGRCTVEAVRELGEVAGSTTGMFAHCWRVVVVDEAHLITERAAGVWLTLLEALPWRWIVIFTTTQNMAGLFGAMGKAFVDRCAYIRLSNQGLCKPFARLAHRIANREGLNGQPVSAYESALKRAGSKNSMRALLAMIARGEFLAETST